MWHGTSGGLAAMLGVASCGAAFSSNCLCSAHDEDMPHNEDSSGYSCAWMERRSDAGTIHGHGAHRYAGMAGAVWSAFELHLGDLVLFGQLASKRFGSLLDGSLNGDGHEAFVCKAPLYCIWMDCAICNQTFVAIVVLPNTPLLADGERNAPRVALLAICVGYPFTLWLADLHSDSVA
jgi:hypothetical protein